MDVPFVVVSAREARAAIGAAWFRGERDAPGPPPAPSRITLHPHQRDALHRLRAALDTFGGALLADEVGLGKTYVALALAVDYPRRLIVAPAALREMWREALTRSGLEAPFVTMESLGRTRSRARVGARRGDASAAAPHPDHAPDLVIVDEAHHARNSATERHRALAALTTSSRVLLLTATPIHNRRADLDALLGLFLGARARDLSDVDLARCVIRRRHGAVSSATALPRVSAPMPLALDHDDALLDAIVALPPPLPPSDGGDGGALLAWTLVRQWISSDGALRAALRRRLARAAALEAALTQGEYPSRGELRAWIAADDAVQLALPGFLTTPPPSLNAAPLLDAVRRHADAAGALLRQLARRPDRDLQRAGHLTRLRGAGVKIVAFAEFAETVHALWRLLRGAPGVAALTADGAQIASGTISRADALARFAPAASRRRPPPESERIDLLITTDLLSEGVNLQDASVVVHLDVPWTAARLEQRVGRVARLGSPHEYVDVWAMTPPASAESLLGLERRLRDKLRAAARSLGVAGAILPSLAPPGTSRTGEIGPLAAASPPSAAEEIRATMRCWSREAGSGGRTENAGTRVAVVRAPAAGFLACCLDGERPFLVADVGDGPTDAPQIVARAVAWANGPAASSDSDPSAVAAADPHDRGMAAVTDGALRALHRWLSARRVSVETDIGAAASLRARRRVIARIAAITRRAPHHLRPAITALAGDARRAASVPCGSGAELVLSQLATAVMPDDAWLRALRTFGNLHAGRAGVSPERGAAPAVMVVFIPAHGLAGGPEESYPIAP